MFADNQGIVVRFVWFAHSSRSWYGRALELLLVHKDAHINAIVFLLDRVHPNNLQSKSLMHFELAKNSFPQLELRL